MDYTKLSRDSVSDALLELAARTRGTFGGLSAEQLNWTSDADRWSVGQCFLHLVTADTLMFDFAAAALERPRDNFWQRLPVLPRLVGQVMIRSQSPETTWRYKAPRKARPAASDVAPDIIARFVSQHEEAARRIQGLDERTAERAIMISPFVRIIAYSVLDGYRLIVAHDMRHFEQARRVLSSPGFPDA